MKRAARFGMALAGASALAIGAGAAQSQTSKPAGASTGGQTTEQAEVRAPKLGGTWKLNSNESDNPKEKLNVRSESRNRSGAGRDTQDPTDPRGGGGPWGGGRRGGMGGGGLGIPGIGGVGVGRPRRRPSQEQTQNDNGRLAEMLQPSSAMMIVRKDPEIDVSDTDSIRELFTDGRKVESPKENASKTQASAKWEQESLVTEEKGPDGEKIARRYAVSEDGSQLYETISVETKHSKDPVTLRYVYDRQPE